MAEVIFCDPIKDFEVRKLFRSLSPKKNKKMSPQIFKKQIYPKFTSFLKKKEMKIKEKIKIQDKHLNESLEKLKYSNLWEKKVVCTDTTPFLERHQADIKRREKEFAKNSLAQKKKEEISVSQCSFHPKIKKSQLVGPRSINDLYQWDEVRNAKRNEQKNLNLDNEMKSCVSKWRTNLKRSQLNKSVHLKERYSLNI